MCFTLCSIYPTVMGYLATGTTFKLAHKNKGNEVTGWSQKLSGTSWKQHRPLVNYLPALHKYVPHRFWGHIYICGMKDGIDEDYLLFSQLKGPLDIKASPSINEISVERIMQITADLANNSCKVDDTQHYTWNALTWMYVKESDMDKNKFERW